VPEVERRPGLRAGRRAGVLVLLEHERAVDVVARRPERPVLRPVQRRRGRGLGEHPFPGAQLPLPVAVLVHEDVRSPDVESGDRRVQEVEPHVRDVLRDDLVAVRLRRGEVRGELGRREPGSSQLPREPRADDGRTARRVVHRHAGHPGVGAGRWRSRSAGGRGAAHGHRNHGRPHEHRGQVDRVQDSSNSHRFPLVRLGWVFELSRDRPNVEGQYGLDPGEDADRGRSGV
jgi:hypothetical protein